PARSRKKLCDSETTRQGITFPNRICPRLIGAARSRDIFPCRRSATNSHPVVSTRKNANVTVYDGTSTWYRAAPRLITPDPSDWYAETFAFCGGWGSLFVSPAQVFAFNWNLSKYFPIPAWMPFPSS